MAKSLKQASKKAQFNNLIDNLVANTGTDKGTFSFNMTVLEQIVAEFISRVKTEINSINDFLVTGNIEELSIKVNNMNEVEILGLSHIIFQSRGVQGALDKSVNSVHSYGEFKPPVSVFIDWVKNRQLITANNSKFFKDSAFDNMTTDEKITQLAYAIRHMVWKKGFQGKGYWDKNVDWLKNELNTRIQANLGEQIKFRMFDRYGNNIQKKK